MKAKLSSLTRRLEELEMRNQHEVQVVTETPVPLQSCLIANPLVTKEITVQLLP